MATLSATRVNDYAFTVTGDLTDLFHTNRRVIMGAASVYTYSKIWKSVYSSPSTTVYINDDGDNDTVPAALDEVAISIGTKEMPNHIHDINEGEGGSSEFRMIMEYVDTDTITITPGAYLLYGTGGINRVMYNNTDLTFDFGPGGSNVASTALPTSGNIYLYLDESVCIAQRSQELTAGCFVANTTAPTWNDANRQWLNGNDRCVWGIPTDSSANIFPFAQNGSRVDYFANGSTPAINYDIRNSYSNTANADFTNYANIPDFSSMAMVVNTSKSCQEMYLKSGSYYKLLVFAFVGVTAFPSWYLTIPTAPGGAFVLQCSAAGTVYLSSSGYILPMGM